MLNIATGSLLEIQNLNAAIEAIYRKYEKGTGFLARLVTKDMTLLLRWASYESRHRTTWERLGGHSGWYGLMGEVYMG